MEPRHVKKKSLGQHFLRDERVAARAADAAGLRPDDVVLEIGPGEGVLTRHLLPRVREVVAVELDEDLARRLEERATPGLRVLRGDAVQVAFPPFDACVSNLPYQISSPILFKLLDHDFRVAVLMVQKEFADRLAAKPDTSAYGRLTVSASTRATVEIVARVGRGAFDPPPQVESALVRLTPRAAPPFPIADAALYDGVVRAAFTQRRKTLSNALRNAGHLASADPARLAAVAPRAPHATRRAGELAPADYGDVVAYLHAEGVPAPRARATPADSDDET